VVDAVRYALLTRDLDYIRVRPDDFHVNAAGEPAADIVIRCKLSGLSDKEKGDFPEHLTYGKGDGTALYVYWRARRLAELGSRRLADVSVRSGPEARGRGSTVLRGNCCRPPISGRSAMLSRRCQPARDRACRRC
jgi:putative ATP-dependent endonuclease of OLD family